ncbi:MAG: hypothetical protein ABEJ86_02040 [Halococcoides sp.]
MTETPTRRLVAAMVGITVLLSTVPLVTTLLLSEFVAIERVLLVAFTPFVVNGALGLLGSLWATRGHWSSVPPATGTVD